MRNELGEWLRSHPPQEIVCQTCVASGLRDGGGGLQVGICLPVHLCTLQVCDFF